LCKVNSVIAIAFLPLRPEEQRAVQVMSSG
jgi:hypothetical protein